MIKLNLTKHLREKNVSYLKHLICALGYCLRIALVLPVLFIHAFLPFVFEETASAKIKKILENMETIGKDV